ncbi:TlpA family protein disulfide reductase [Nonlabens ulvanivorans]|uniref:TlpA family protein disulfide reductase n=1 Tax=Nonlabens ulvanivorans TaxID=906888 RepID=UPI0037C6A052
MNHIIIIAFTLLSITCHGQKKKMWAKSFLHKPAPQLVVEEWVSNQPETEGKFILVDFWATWCAPCKRAMPDLNEFQTEFKDDLVVIGISDESKEKVLRQRNPKIEYYSALDSQQRMKTALEVKAIPHAILIDPDGIVVWEGYPLLAGNELTSEVIAKHIASYKKKKVKGR